MNENKDVVITTANNASQNNPWANLVTHTVAMVKNVSLLWFYNYQLGMANAMGPGYLSAEQINTYKHERIKHTALLALGCLGLIIVSTAALQENKR